MSVLGNIWYNTNRKWKEKVVAKSISEQLYYESIKYTLIRERIKNTYIQIKDG